MKRDPIAILGFGRSGTTWVSDIFSKALGELILFEPMSPTVLEQAAACCYGSSRDRKLAGILHAHLSKVMAGSVRHKWLLRNHLNRELEVVSEQFVEDVWENCGIAGFKEIRANFFLEAISGEWRYNTIFVVRDPLAVIASLANRPRFWKGDFRGLDNHYRMFRAQVLTNPEFAGAIGSVPVPVEVTPSNIVQVEAVMWAATHRMVFDALARTPVPLLFYEDLFRDPFKVARSALRKLGLSDAKLHPSYIFTPSMATMRTTHDLEGERERKDGALDFFHKGKLTAHERDVIARVMADFGVDIYDEHSLPMRDRLDKRISIIDGSSAGVT
jgi:hypothetical protein